MNTKILQKLGAKIKETRKAKGITQEYLAEKVNIHQTYVGKLEAGKSNLSVLLLYKISKILDIELSELFNFK
ncbi:MAG: helix-turn-helix transcriptional regulator [Candidatus Gastranaerophilales bacterium]|nr:helix-turn-helix transcriptional regulator [Candidatus Gastranaerophilales bacterium]